MHIEKNHLQVVVALLLIAYGGYSLWLTDSELLTGLVLYNGSAELQWVNPTPADDALVNAPFFVLNVTASENVSSVLLEFNGVNESLTQSGVFWSAKKNVTGTHSYIAYAIMSDNSTLPSTRRSLRYGYVNLSPIQDRDVTEDSTLPSVALASLVSSNDKSSLTFNLTFSDDKLACSVANFNISCIPQANRTGRTNITIKAIDGPLSSTQSFIVNITQVNDAPYQTNAFPLLRIPDHKNASIEWQSYVADVEESALTLTPINNSFAQGLVKNSKLWILPLAAGFTEFNISVSDGNASTVFTIPLNITENHAPQLYESIQLVNWSENGIGTVRFTQLFYDIDGDYLVYNATKMENISFSISSQSIFFIPDMGWTGERMTTLKAFDGEFTTEKSMLLRVTPLNGVSVAPIAQEAPPAQLGPSLPIIFSPLEWQEDSEMGLELMDFVAIDALKQESLQISVTGTSQVQAVLDGTRVRFTPQANFHGTETATITITDGATSYQGDLQLVVKNIDDPLQKVADLPSVLLHQNKSQVEIDLSEYFRDPDGNVIDFAVTAGDGVNVSFKSKSVVVLSLAGGSGNVSARVIARASNGRELAGDMLVTLIDAVKSDRAWGRLFLQSVFILLLLVVVGAGAYNYRQGMAFRKTRLNKMHKTIDEVYEDPEMRRVLKMQALQHHKVASPSERAMRFLDDGITRLTKMYQDFKLQQKTRYQEPAELRKEVLYIKETISSIRAIMTSSNDRLITSALKAEKDRLMRAYHSVQGKSELSRDELRKLLLYVMESTSALQEIAAVSEDMLITFEVRRQASKMRKVLDNLSFKLEDSYHR